MAAVQGSTTGRSLKHVAIREYVRSLVGDRAPGTPAPSERELVDRFGVARMTVRQALDALVGEGVLERHPGRGTFVAGPRRTATGVRGLTDELALRGVAVETRTLVAESVPAGEAMAGAFRVHPEEPLVRWVRLRVGDGRPVCLSETYLPAAFAGDLLDHLPASLYDELAARGHRPTWAEDAVSAGLATDEEATLLELPQGSPVLRLTRRALDGETVVEMSRSVLRGEDYTLHLQLRD
ncbi:GntR family transcriptional regulator [Nocardioides aromaticivorans]|uniref:GntR family transcriptional regulator n=1 Tax=Nocardioides aromaticivorans TaxID=200618 RepID=A0A7Y9ZFD7_9ACTN|nr:GntR family transcriptional regulator [Nocardioides aromaticivorans]NYI43986.1 GntR family transcriptional regulator [Nocardioides aromaticivorans]